MTEPSAAHVCYFYTSSAQAVASCKYSDPDCIVVFRFNVSWSLIPLVHRSLTESALKAA